MALASASSLPVIRITYRRPRCFRGLCVAHIVFRATDIGDVGQDQVQRADAKRAAALGPIAPFAEPGTYCLPLSSVCLPTDKSWDPQACTLRRGDDLGEPPLPLGPAHRCAPLRYHIRQEGDQFPRRLSGLTRAGDDDGSALHNKWPDVQLKRITL